MIFLSIVHLWQFLEVQSVCFAFLFCLLVRGVGILSAIGFVVFVGRDRLGCG